MVPQLVLPLEDELDELDELDDIDPEELDIDPDDPVVLPEELDIDPDEPEAMPPRPPVPPLDDDTPPVAVPVPLDAPVPLFPLPLLLAPELRDPLVAPELQAAATTRGEARRATMGSRWVLMAMLEPRVTRSAQIQQDVFPVLVRGTQHTASRMHCIRWTASLLAAPPDRGRAPAAGPLAISS
jgi:hypothetical protein